MSGTAIDQWNSTRSRRMTIRHVGVFVLGAVLWGSSGCRGDEPAQIGPLFAVSATRISGGVRIVNGTDEALAYAVWNPDFLGLFAPCVDPTPACVRLGAWQTVDVADQDIVGYAPGAREAVVRWWRVIPDGAGGYRAGEVFEIPVSLIE